MPRFNEGDEDVYELDMIIDKRTNIHGRVEYLAMWAAPYTADDATWEPSESFDPSAIEDFEDEAARMLEIEQDLEQDANQAAVGTTNPTPVAQENTDTGDEASASETPGKAEQTQANSAAGEDGVQEDPDTDMQDADQGSQSNTHGDGRELSPDTLEYLEIFDRYIDYPD